MGCGLSHEPAYQTTTYTNALTEDDNTEEIKPKLVVFDELDYTRLAAGLTPEHDPDRARRLYNLGMELIKQYAHETHDAAELDEAIAALKQAVKLQLVSYPDWANWLVGQLDCLAVPPSDAFTFTTASAAYPDWNACFTGLRAAGQRIAARRR